jgi:DNA-binding NtrC family response regulator
MKVLIVEDEGIIAWDLESMVLDNGFEVAGLARTEIEALSLARRADIALVDVQLADGPTGPQIARTLIDLYGIEVVFMTGNPEIVAGFEGAVGVVTKPHHLHKVKSALMDALAARTRKRDARSSGATAA